MSSVFSQNSLEHALAGSTGTVLSTLLLFPLDRLKTLLQIDDSSSMTLSDMLARVLREEGIRGLYTGCSPMLQTVGSSNFLYFFLFKGLQASRIVGKSEYPAGPYETLASSAIAGALNMLVTEPLWRGSVVLQSKRAADVQGPIYGSASRAPVSGVLGIVCEMWRQEGPRALWRGLGSSLWLVSNPIIQFFVYDLLKACRQSTDAISAKEAFAMGAVAKALATIVTFPLQVAQSRLRNAKCGKDGMSNLQGMLPVLRAIFAEKGFRGLYIGMLPKLLQSVTQAAIMFAIYEKVHWAIRRMSRKGWRHFVLQKRTIAA